MKAFQDQQSKETLVLMYLRSELEKRHHIKDWKSGIKFLLNELRSKGHVDFQDTDSEELVADCYDRIVGIEAR